MTKIRTLLIANRGEIACRIIKTAKKMNIRTIAIYSDADRNAQHVKLADTAYHIGPSPAKESYLNIAKILDVAKQSGADAIHPGYGFLSENTEFCEACHQNNIIFIGPSIDAIRIMGSKQTAKLCLQDTSVPMTPGYHNKDQSNAVLLAAAQKIGYPVLLKAASGGGGKGMKVVRNNDEFEMQLNSAKREALSSFADDTIIIEKLIESPRHVEVQIMADSKGNVVHLFTRDCSIQRRHQKVIEEAPAPNLSEETLEKLYAASIAVSKKINYLGAGTIEYLVDKSENFYFMEMNTRLQVEHPVTEMITGLDLVEWQIKIAQGEAFPKTQAEITKSGHAIECRVYAEDPDNNFLPSIGQITYLKLPQASDIRIDTGIICHDSISQYYDPMISKIITYAETRECALLKMYHRLNAYRVLGIKTNLKFLSSILSNEKFKSCQLSTHFLEEASLSTTASDIKKGLALLATFNHFNLNQSQDKLIADTISFTPSGSSSIEYHYQFESNAYAFKIRTIKSDELIFEYNNQYYLIHYSFDTSIDQFNIQVTPDADKKSSILYKAQISNFSNQILVDTFDDYFVFEKISAESLHTSTETKNQLTAPMPSTVVALLKSLGEIVNAGDSIMMLEAMKMEHAIKAPHDGKIKEFYYQVGDKVNEGSLLLALEKDEK